MHYKIIIASFAAIVCIGMVSLWVYAVLGIWSALAQVLVSLFAVAYAVFMLLHNESKKNEELAT
ncbi:MAG: hypothetical protein ACTSW4_02625 [Candidatus Ranarchaeia archaeon]